MAARLTQRWTASRAALAAGLAAHTADAIDFAALAGKTVAVIGAAASAFDAAAFALEAGAAAVHLFARRDHIAARAVAKPRGYTGFYDHFPRLPDAHRWHHAVHYRRAGSTPPPDAVRRVLAHDNFHLHLASPWETARVADGRVVADVNGRDFAFDFVIAGTGYGIDPAQRPELARIAPLVARWRDRYTPPTGERDDALGASPYSAPAAASAAPGRDGPPARSARRPSQCARSRMPMSPSRSSCATSPISQSR